MRHKEYEYISDMEPLLCQELFVVVLYAVLHVLNQFSFSITITWNVVSNLCCALSLSWFIIQTIFGISVNDTVHCLYSDATLFSELVF